MQSSEVQSAMVAVRDAAAALVAAIDRLIAAAEPVKAGPPESGEPGCEVQRDGKRSEVVALDEGLEGAEEPVALDATYSCKVIVIRSINTLLLAVKTHPEVKRVWMRLDDVFPISDGEFEHYRDVSVRYLEELLRGCALYAQFTGIEPSCRTGRLYLADEAKKPQSLNSFLTTYGLARGNKFLASEQRVSLFATVGNRYGQRAAARHIMPPRDLYLRCCVLHVLSGDTVIANMEPIALHEVIGGAYVQQDYHGGGTFVLRLTGFICPRMLPDGKPEEYKNERKSAVAARDALQALVAQYQAPDASAASSSSLKKSRIWCKIGPTDAFGRFLVILYGAKDIYSLNCPACIIDRQPAHCIRKSSKGCSGKVEEVACFNRILIGQGHGRENERGLFVWPDE